MDRSSAASFQQQQQNLELAELAAKRRLLGLQRGPVGGYDSGAGLRPILARRDQLVLHQTSVEPPGIWQMPLAGGLDPHMELELRRRCADRERSIRWRLAAARWEQEAHRQQLERRQQQRELELERRLSEQLELKLHRLLEQKLRTQETPTRDPRELQLERLLALVDAGAVGGSDGGSGRRVHAWQAREVGDLDDASARRVRLRTGSSDSVRLVSSSNNRPSGQKPIGLTLDDIQKLREQAAAAEDPKVRQSVKSAASNRSLRHAMEIEADFSSGSVDNDDEDEPPPKPKTVVPPFKPQPTSLPLPVSPLSAAAIPPRRDSAKSIASTVSYHSNRSSKRVSSTKSAMSRTLAPQAAKDESESATEASMWAAARRLTEVMEDSEMPLSVDDLNDSQPKSTATVAYGQGRRADKAAAPQRRSVVAENVADTPTPESQPPLLPESLSMTETTQKPLLSTLSRFDMSRAVSEQSERTDGSESGSEIIELRRSTLHPDQLKDLLNMQQRLSQSSRGSGGSEGGGTSGEPSGETAGPQKLPRAAVKAAPAAVAAASKLTGRSRHNKLPGPDSTTQDSEQPRTGGGGREETQDTNSEQDVFQQRRPDGNKIQLLDRSFMLAFKDARVKAANKEALAKSTTDGPAAVSSGSGFKAKEAKSGPSLASKMAAAKTLITRVPPVQSAPLVVKPEDNFTEEDIEACKALAASKKKRREQTAATNTGDSAPVQGRPVATVEDSLDDPDDDDDEDVAPVMQKEATIVQPQTQTQAAPQQQLELPVAFAFKEVPAPVPALARKTTVADVGDQGVMPLERREKSRRIPDDEFQQPMPLQTVQPPAGGQVSRRRPRSRPRRRSVSRQRSESANPPAPVCCPTPVCCPPPTCQPCRCSCCGRCCYPGFTAVTSFCGYQCTSCCRMC